MVTLIFIHLLIAGLSLVSEGNHDHHHHHNDPVPNCFTTHCDKHRPFCQISYTSPLLKTVTGVCAEYKDCMYNCGTPSSTEGCCCYDQPCVDNFSHSMTQANVGGKMISVANTIACPHCGDLRHCDTTVMETCHPHGHDQHDPNHQITCMIKEHPDGKIETKCAEMHECMHQHHGETITCCQDANCTMSKLQYYKIGSTSALTCPHCHDYLKNDCHGHATCHPDESCLINHIDGRVETGCMKKDHCQHQIQNSMLHPNQIAICCDTATCVRTAEHTIAPSSTVAPVQVTHACADNETGSFKCSEYESHFHICSNMADSYIANLVNSHCKATCGLCGGIPISFTAPAQTNPQTTQAPPKLATILQTIINTQMVPSSTTKSPAVVTHSVGTTLQTTTKMQTTATPVPTVIAYSSPASLPAPTCVDLDVKNACHLYGFYLCAAKDGQAKQFAILNCAKTCNKCAEHYALMKQGNNNQQTTPFSTTKGSTQSIG